MPPVKVVSLIEEYSVNLKLYQKIKLSYFSVENKYR